MSARNAAKPKAGKGKQRKPHVSVGVADQTVSRSARAIASAWRWGKKQDDFDVREVEVGVEITRAEGERDRFGPLGAPESEVWINCTVSCASGEQRKIEITDAKLADLPLLAMALQEAVRVGVRRGSFPPVLGAEGSHK